MLALPDIRQTANHDCGIAVCRVVMRYYGKKWQDNFEKMLNACEIDGTDPRNIEFLFRKSGFGVLSGELTVPDIRHFIAMKRPVITLVQRFGIGHYIVVNDVKSRRIDYHCPVDGLVKCSIRKFRESWRDVGRMGTIYNSFGIVPWPANNNP